MTPIPRITKKSPVSPEKYYTNVHAQTHQAVTETIKQLKSRWKCLQATCNKQFDPQTVAMLIVACCVLHNICNRRGLPVVPFTQTEERLEAMKQKVANSPISRKQVEDPSGVQARVMLVDRLWNERRVPPETCSGPKKRQKKDKPIETHPPPMSHPQMMQPHMHHEDPNKRPRIVMNNPTYSLGMAPGWGHYPHQ